jgi:peroxiredoxin Q/BCP
MSKKTRKKSSQASPTNSVKASGRKRPAAKATGQSPKASAKKSAAKAAKTAKTASKTTNKTTKMAAGKPAKAAKTASPKASHKPPSKQLIKSDPSAPPKATIEATSSPASGIELVEGAVAPAFHLRRDGGDSVSLGDYAGKKLVLFFFPRADTPGCTREAIDFTRLSGAFADEGAAVLGISADSVKAQESFRNKHQLSVPLISDEKHEMLQAYGAWGEKSMYGRSFMGVIRTTVLIGADGRIARIWRNVRVDGHADEVLAAVREM